MRPNDLLVQRTKVYTDSHTHYMKKHEIHSSIIIQYAMLANLLSVVANVITKKRTFCNSSVCVRQ